MPGNCKHADNDGPENNVVDKLPLYVQECIKNVIEKEEFITYDVNVENIQTNGGNYLGLLQTVVIKGKGTTGDKQINLFIKNKLYENEDLNWFSLSDVYRLESFVYKELFGIYDELQNEYKIPEAKRFNIVKSYHEINSKVIILEDLSKAGFETINRREVFSLQFAEFSVMQMARFHGLSFVLQNKQPKYFDEKLKPLKYSNTFTPEWVVLIKRIFDITVDCLEGEAKVKLDNYFPSYLEKMKQYFKFPGEQAVCLCHGDFRANNMLVKKVNGEISKVHAVDYQFVNYNTPIFDFLYFIFAGSDQEFRNRHLEYLKDLYYKSLEDFLELFGLQAANFYTQDRFEKEFKENMDLGLITLVLLTPFLFTVDEDVPELDSTDIKFNMGVGYKERVRETVDFFIQEGYL